MNNISAGSKTVLSVLVLLALMIFLAVEFGKVDVRLKWYEQKIEAARIAKNAVIEPFVNIERNVEVGEGTWIGSNVTIMEGVKIGKNCKIFPGAVIGAIPQDLKYAG